MAELEIKFFGNLSVMKKGTWHSKCQTIVKPCKSLGHFSRDRGIVKNVRTAWRSKQYVQYVALRWCRNWPAENQWTCDAPSEGNQSLHVLMYQIVPGTLCWAVLETSVAMMSQTYCGSMELSVRRYQALLSCYILPLSASFGIRLIKHCQLRIHINQYRTGKVSWRMGGANRHLAPVS